MMKELKWKDTIGIGVYSGETVEDCIRKYGRKSILEILKYYDLDENILKLCHFRSLDKDNPEKDNKEQDWVQELLDYSFPVGETFETTTTQDVEEYPNPDEEVVDYPWYCPVDYDPEDDEFGPPWGPGNKYKPWIYG